MPEPALLSAIQAEEPDRSSMPAMFAREVIEALKRSPDIAVIPIGFWATPKDHQLTINGLKVVLAHGHFSIWHWFWNYVHLFSPAVMTTFFISENWQKFIRRRISSYTGIFTILTTK